MQRMLDISPPIGCTIQMYPRGHVSQGYAHYLMSDSSCDERVIEWLRDLLFRYEQQVSAVPTPVEPTEIVAASGEVISLLDMHKEPCTCGHIKRFHEHYQGECAQIGCTCTKFELKSAG